MTGTEWVAVFMAIYISVNVALDDVATGWKELCEGWDGIYAPSEQLLRQSGNLQYWGCFGPEEAPRPHG